MILTRATATVLLILLAATNARAVKPKEEIEVTAGAVTALSCAIEAHKTGDLTLLGACPLSEVKSGLVIVDVAEKQIYRVTKKKLSQHELESAFGGGSVDLSGVVKSVDKAGVALIEVTEYSVSKKKKPGGFKGCL